MNCASNTLQVHLAIVRPILQFCSVLWNPSQIGLIESLERVQRRFDYALLPLRDILIRIPLNVHLESQFSGQSYNSEALASRRSQAAGVYFMFKLVNSLISCPELLQYLNFHVPQYWSRILSHVFNIPIPSCFLWLQ